MKHRFWSSVLVLCLCTGLLVGTASAQYTLEEAEARGMNLEFSTETLDFGTAEYREGAELFPETRELTVTNNGDEPLRYFGWGIAGGTPIEVVSEEGLYVSTEHESGLNEYGWGIFSVDTRWLLPGDTATFTFRCTLDEVREYDSVISLMLEFVDSKNSIAEHDIYYPIAVRACVTGQDYGRELSVDKDSLEFIWNDSGDTPAPQTVTVTHTGVTDQTYRVQAGLELNGSLLDFTLSGGHQEGQKTYPDITYLSPGEKCIITVEPRQDSYSNSRNEFGTLWIDAEINPDADNPGAKDNEKITIDLTTRELIDGGYAINAWPKGFGTLTPSRTYNDYSVIVPRSGSQTFSATPDPGYMVAALYADGVNVGRVSSYTFTEVQDNHDLDAVFQKADWPYWCAPQTWEIWSNYNYTDVSTQMVNGVESTVYIYPVGTRFYSSTWMLAKPSGAEGYLDAAMEYALEPGTVYTLRLANGNTATAKVLLEGEPSAAPSETADTPSAWAATQVEQAIAAGLVPAELQSGYTQTATRAQFCALAAALYENAGGAPITQRVTFSDTTDPNVEKMAALGVVTGVGDGRFDPNGTLTREQAATMLARLAEALGRPLPMGTASFRDGASIASWAAEAVSQVQAAGIMEGTGDGNFTPQGSYTREQSILTILRLYQTLG